jgi:hypothetical protein
VSIFIYLTSKEFFFAYRTCTVILSKIYSFICSLVYYLLLTSLLQVVSMFYCYQTRFRCPLQPLERDEQQRHRIIRGRVKCHAKNNNHPFLSQRSGCSRTLPNTGAG